MTTKQTSSYGFTLIELLVFIAILAVLTAVLAPAFNSGREMVNRAQCASNLRQIGMAVHIDAQQNDKRFPVKYTGNWAWDVDVSIVDRLKATGAVTKESFYCPSGPVELADEMWEFAVNSGFRALTYLLLFDGTAGIDSRYGNRYLGEQTVFYLGHTPESVVIPESERELAVDAVISLGNTVDSDFMGIQGWLTEPLLRTNHMNGDRPAGGNILYMDGTVEWREFSELRLRSVVTHPSWWW